MASQKRKKVSVQYRKLEDLTGGFGTHSLQSALAQCMQQQTSAEQGVLLGETVSARQWNDDPSYGTLVLNYYDDRPDYYFGEIVRFEPGADLPLLALTDNVKTYNLTQAKAPDGHEPIKGVLYFLAIKNHVMLLESDLSSSRAERYLTWLLSKKSSLIADTAHIILAAELSPDSGSSILSQVDEIIVKPRPIGAVDKQVDDLIGTTTTSTSKGVSETNTLEVLRAAGMDDTDIKKLIDDESSIEVTLQIRFKGQRRRRPLGIEDANRLLRNIPEDELVLSGPGGRQRNGKIVKLAYPANIEQIGSLFITRDVARALYEAYKYFTANGYIDT